MPLDLSGVDIKLRRAETHLTALRGAMQEFVEVELKNSYTVAMEDDPTSSEHKVLVWTNLPTLDPVIGAVLGDFAHNARSALDQLVWMLVRVNGGTPGGHTQWPVYKHKNEWKSHISHRAPDRKGFAPTHGLSNAALSLVESFQPFTLPQDERERSPLSQLALVNNYDKHRTIHASYPFPSELDAGPTFQPAGFLEAINPQKPAHPVPAQNGAVIMRFELREIRPVPRWLQITMRPPGIGVHVAFYSDDKFMVGVDHLDPMLAEVRKVYDAAMELPEVKASK